MNKSTWVIDAIKTDWGQYRWKLFLRENPAVNLFDLSDYTRKGNAILSARRMAKRLRISAEVEE